MATALRNFFQGLTKKRSAEDEEEARAAKRAKHAADSFDKHVTEHDGNGLVELSEGCLWHVTARFAGNGPPWRRMIIYRPADTKDLVLLSPTAVDEETMSAIEKLGTPAVLIIPNSYHRTDAAVFKQRYPSAKVASPPGWAATAIGEVVEVDMDATDLRDLYPEKVNVLRISGIAKESGQDFELAYEFRCADGTWAFAVTDTLMNFREASFMNWVFGCKGLECPAGCPKMGRISKWLVHSRPEVASWYRWMAERKDVSMILMAHGEVYRGDTAAAFNAIADDVETSRS